LGKGKWYCGEHHIIHTPYYTIISILKKYLTFLCRIVKEYYTRQKSGSNNDDTEYKHISSIEEATYVYVMGFRIEGDLIIRYRSELFMLQWVVPVVQLIAHVCKANLKFNYPLTSSGCAMWGLLHKAAFLNTKENWGRIEQAGFRLHWHVCVLWCCWIRGEHRHVTEHTYRL
jgi:hypothetical protein